ncbi:MAG: hypothetical protein AAGF89_09770 [Bacteroidota bacterium]
MRPINLKQFLPCLFLLVAVTSFSNSVRGQSEYGIEINLLQPTGRFGHVFKAAPGLRITKSFSDTDKAFQFRSFIGVFNFSPRRDTVNVGWYDGSNPSSQSNNRVFIGSQEIHKRNLYFTLGTQVMYRPFIDQALRPYAVFEIQGMYGVIDREIISVEGSLDEGGGDGGAGVGGGIGVEYLTEGNFTFYLNIIRSYNFSAAHDGFVYWNSALGVMYLF